MLVGDPVRERGSVFEVNDDPVMKVAVDALEKLISCNRMTLRAKGLAIPNAVAIANIVTEKIADGGTQVESIIVDSEVVRKMGRAQSIIEITLVRP